MSICFMFGKIANFQWRVGKVSDMETTIASFRDTIIQSDIGEKEFLRGFNDFSAEFGGMIMESIDAIRDW